MTPNLFLATQKVFQPHKWFRAPKTQQSRRVTEYWTSPEPGQYEYIPGRGWYLVAKLKSTPTSPTYVKDSEGETAVSITSPSPENYERLARPIPVHRSRVLGRYLLEDDYKARKRTTVIQNERGKRIQAGFFQLDNGVAWVHCWDENGIFIPGGTTGYKLWCIDAATKEFRHMRKGDDPNFVRSRPASPQPRTRDRDLISHPSQDSISTAFRSAMGSGPPSLPSTRASSIRSPLSNASSRAHSRRNSPRRNNSIPLEEAKAALRRMAKEQEEAVARAAAAKNRGMGVERGRQLARA